MHYHQRNPQQNQQISQLQIQKGQNINICNSIQPFLYVAANYYYAYSNMSIFSNPHKKKRNFINPEHISRHLFCCICQDVFADAVRTLCGHTFCYLCIERWATFKKHCPVCKRGFGHRQLEKDLIANKIIDDLEVKCMHVGCGWQGTESLRNKHQRCCAFKPKKDKTQECTAVEGGEQILQIDQ